MVGKHNLEEWVAAKPTNDDEILDEVATVRGS